MTTTTTFLTHSLEWSMLQNRNNPESSHYLGKGSVFVLFPVKGAPLSRERGRGLVVKKKKNIVGTVWGY